MSKSNRPLRLGSIERLIFRPLFVFLTFSMVLLAVFQSSGRFAMYTLHLFEDELNLVLESQNIALQGVRGTWRGLNPVVVVDSVRFPAGVVAQAEAELDVLESMFRSALILKRVNVTKADIFVEQTSQGWRLRGMTGQNQFDATALLRHSDQLEGKLRVHLAGANGTSDVLEAELSVINREGIHFSAFNLHNTSAEAEVLQGQVWQRDLVGLFDAGVNAVNLSGSLRLPQAILGQSELTLRLPRGTWLDAAGLGGGSLQAQIQSVSLPKSNKTLNAQIELVAQRDGSRIGGKASEVSIEVAQHALQFPSMYFTVHVPIEEQLPIERAKQFLKNQPEPPTFSLWLAELDLSNTSEYFNTHFSDLQPVALWIEALALQGRAHNVHFFFDQQRGIGYEGFIADLALQGYKGVPTVDNMQARIWGHEAGLAIQVKGSESYLHFPGLYEKGWTLAEVQGVVKVRFYDGYLGVQGTHLKAMLDNSRVAGGFSVTRPETVSEQRLSLQIHADEVELLRAKSFVPVNLPKTFADWLSSGPRGGVLRDAQYASHGQIKQKPGELGRRIELVSQLRDGEVEYHPQWPVVSDIDAQVHLAGLETRISIASALSQDLTVGESEVRLVNNAAYASGNVDVVGDVSAMLEFVATSALKDTLGFITPQWSGSGSIAMRGDLLVPIRTDASPPLSVDLEFDLGEVDLNMPNYRISLGELAGSGSFSLPHHLSGEFDGLLFGNPGSFSASSDDSWLSFAISGAATPEDVYTILETQQAIPAEGMFEFDSVLSLAMGSGITNLSVVTDLEGLQVGLPGLLAKESASIVSGELDLQFLSDYQSVRWRYGDVSGWLHYGDGIERGAVGLSSAPPMTTQEENAIVIGGHMASLQLQDWVGGNGDSAINLPIDWKIRNLSVDRFLVDELEFENLKLDGEQRGTEVSFDFDSPRLRGRAVLPGDDALSLDIAYVKFLDPNEGVEQHIGQPQVDLITVEVGHALPQAKISIDQIDIGDDPFGAWRFDILPGDNEVAFRNFSADVNGVHIEDSTLKWDLANDRSEFRGHIRLDDLAETLPKWDYAASLSSDDAATDADISWAGSPLNVSLLGSRGDLTFSAHSGRFIEVEAGGGGLRILSLLNFTKAAKRINFDFSDVVGEGLSFDTIEGSFSLNEGELTFPRRLKIEGSSGKFQVGGQVDLRSGVLDNEMIVTLPVSKSLPWYGLYLALANPLVGVGVVVGERVLRKPIEQFSTAKYVISGTLDDPQLKFVSLWDQSMKEQDVTEEAVEQAVGTQEAAVPPESE